MAEETVLCKRCEAQNEPTRYFCRNCGEFLRKQEFIEEKLYSFPQLKVMRIIENLNHVPHSKIVWNDMIDLYARKVERFRALFTLPEGGSDKNSELCNTMEEFLNICYKPEFQIAFVGTIKTGKSTLINALLGRNYASMAVTPETAALTKFRSSARDYVRITFYGEEEWEKLWKSRTSAADAFMQEYKELKAEQEKTQWVGHEEVYKELENEAIEQELSVWSSSKRAEHYFVKEIEVGISTLPKDFPKQVVFVDTPGLSDPVAYRSEITRQYIRKANAVFVCVDAQKMQRDEIETISSVFSFSSHNKNKVHIIATHWDKLNAPVADWETQKKWMKKRLVGKGFFDSEEMAEKNILHSAAHIFNLCRDFDKLEMKEKLPLMQFALLFEISPDWGVIKEVLPRLRKTTNIDTISEIISSELAGKYQTLLNEDIHKKYVEIVYNLRRIATEGRDEAKEIMDISNADIDRIKQEVDKKKKDYEEINKTKSQLALVLETVEKSTQKRLDMILPRLEAMSKGV